MHGTGSDLYGHIREIEVYLVGAEKHPDSA